jgi:hypothetical protein
MEQIGAGNMPIYAQPHVVSVIASLKTGSVSTTETAVLIFVPEAFAAASAEAMLARSRSSVAVATVEETEPVVEVAVGYKWKAIATVTSWLRIDYCI